MRKIRFIELIIDELTANGVVPAVKSREVVKFGADPSLLFRRVVASVRRYLPPSS